MEKTIAKADLKKDCQHRVPLNIWYKFPTKNSDKMATLIEFLNYQSMAVKLLKAVK